MNILKNYVLFTMALMASFALISCSKDLSKSRAKEMIIQKRELPRVVSIVLAKWYVVDYVDGLSVPLDSLVNSEKYYLKEELLNKLEKDGFVKLLRTGPEGNCRVVQIRVLLTDESKKYLEKEDQKYYQLKVYDRCFGKITGIQSDEQKKMAIVEYTQEVEHPTPFFKYLTIFDIPSGKYTEKFELYDDGWRILK